MTHAARILATESNLTATTTHFGSLAQVVANQPQQQQPVLLDLGNSRGALVQKTQQVLAEQTAQQQQLRNSATDVIADTNAFSAGVEKCRIATMQILNSARAQGLGVNVGGGSVFAPTRDKTQLAIGYNNLLASVGSAMDTFDEKMAANIAGYSAKLAHTAPTSTATHRPTTLLNTKGFGAVSGTPEETDSKKKTPVTFSASADPNNDRGDAVTSAPQIPGAGPAKPDSPTSVTLEYGGDTKFDLNVGKDGRLDTTGGSISSTIRSQNGTPAGQISAGYTPGVVSVGWKGPDNDFHAGVGVGPDDGTVKLDVGGDTPHLSVDAELKFIPTPNSVEGKVDLKYRF